MGTCLDCEENFYMEEGVEVGDVVDCPKCRIRMEVLNTFPTVNLDYAAPED